MATLYLFFRKFLFFSPYYKFGKRSKRAHYNPFTKVSLALLLIALILSPFIPRQVAASGFFNGSVKFDEVKNRDNHNRFHLCSHPFKLPHRPEADTVIAGNTGLSALTISTGSLSPQFNPVVYNYTANVPNDINTITIKVMAADTTAAITINGRALTGSPKTVPFYLAVGENSLTATVTTNNNTVTSYTVIVTRAASSNSNLADLTVSQGVLDKAFGSDVLEYSTEIKIESKKHAIYSMGDSITSNGEYGRYLDSLLNKQFHYVNLGISGDRVSNMVNRFPSIVRCLPDYTIILGGINDIRATPRSAVAIEADLQTMYTAAHAAGIKVIALTLTPAANNPGWDEAKQARLDSVNAWIPTAMYTDYSVDTYKALGDPANPRQMLQLYDSGDGLHPSRAGQDAMARAIFATVTFIPNPAVDLSNRASNTVSVTAVASDSTATITVNNAPVLSGIASAPIQMIPGQNTVFTEVTAANGAKKTYQIHVKAAPSADALLANLSISNGGKTLSPNFYPDSLNYKTDVVNALRNLIIIPMLHNPLATLKINGINRVSGIQAVIPLLTGITPIVIIVTAPDGVTSKTYTFKINNQQPNDATLTAFSTGTRLAPMPGSGYLNYATSVLPSVNNLIIKATTRDTAATMTVNGQPLASGTPSKPIALNYGLTTVTLEVTSRDKSITNAYIFTVSRPLSHDAVLSAVSTGTKLITTTGPDYKDYTSTVTNTTASINVKAVAHDTSATIAVNGVLAAGTNVLKLVNLKIGLNIINITVTAQDKITVNHYVFAITRLASADATLNSLNSSVKLTAVSGPGYKNYTSLVPGSINAITVTAAAHDSTATITLSGTKLISGQPSQLIPLAAGLNTITVLVTAQNGVTVKSYIITVNRPISNDATLKSLTTGTLLTQVDGPGDANYITSAANPVKSMAVKAFVNQASATITINGTAVASGRLFSVPLNVGINLIKIIVTAQDKATVKSYIITATREPSADASLKRLTASAILTPTDGPGYKNFLVSVTANIASIAIKPVVNDATASVKINGTTVPSGTNFLVALNAGVQPINIIVTAQDGITINNYIITANRVFSADAELRSLTASVALTPSSGDSYKNYSALVPATAKSITIKPVSNNARAAITINGTPGMSGVNITIPLNPGSNLINIVVTAQDGATVKIYSILVTHQVSTLANIYAADLLKPSIAPDETVKINVHQAISPNGDGISDFLFIEGITAYPDNKLCISTRNGALVYQANGYDNNSKVFDGHSSITNKMQPPGTYFYSLQYSVNGRVETKSGFLVLKY